MNKIKERHILEIVNKIHIEFNEDLPINLDSILKRFGFTHQKLNLDNDVSGALIINENAKLICTNANDSEKRERFSIAHELGHYFIHHIQDLELTKSATYLRDKLSSTGVNDKEIEANYFAACLLMPEEKIKELVNFNISFDKNVEKLSKDFNVSETAMAIRLNKLGFM